MKTIAQQLNVKDFPFSIKDANGNEIYFENSNGFWYINEWDADSREIYSINSNGYWWRGKYDVNGNTIYFECSTGYWWRREFDANGNKIYFEDSTGTIIDNRPKSREDKPVYKTVIEIDGAKYLLTKI
jgi:hypothetical protein